MVLHKVLWLQGSVWDCVVCVGTHWNSWVVGVHLLLLAWTSIDWLDNRDSCSDLIMIFTVLMTLSTLIVSGVYVGIIVIGIS